LDFPLSIADARSNNSTSSNTVGCHHTSTVLQILESAMDILQYPQAAAAAAAAAATAAAGEEEEEFEESNTNQNGWEIPTRSFDVGQEDNVTANAVSPSSAVTAITKTEEEEDDHNDSTVVDDEPRADDERDG
jgi:hypothetical protein